MYRPGMGVDPWYENFKFFLTYWLLSSNNRERTGDVDQIPPPQPPSGSQGHPFMLHKNNNHEHQGQGAHNQNTKSPNSSGSRQSSGNSALQINWDSSEKHNQQSGNSPRHGLNMPLLEQQSLPMSDNYPSNISLKQHMDQPSHSNGLNSVMSHGNPLNSVPNAMLPEHIIVDKDRRHVCPHCYKGFRSRQQLNQHNLVHSGLRKYHCLYCERAFKQLSHLQQHHRIHTGEKPYRCPLDGCDKAFAQMSNLQHHMRQHDKTTFGQKQCMCPFCDRGYASEKSLKSHLSKMHPDSKLLDPKSTDGQGHHMLGSQQSGSGHNNSLPMMHHSMKSPLAQSNVPLELKVHAHQRNSMASEARKFTLETNKFPMNTSDISHDGKIYQRSLSDRFPERASEKLENMFEHRFGLQNPFRDGNRFNDRMFEPFSPSRLQEAVRTFDFKDIEAKLFDPSGDKFQRMSESLDEFRLRFQDHMFRREGGARPVEMPFDGRNVLQEMNDRNMYFDSRNNIDNVHKERFLNGRNISISDMMNISDIDNSGSNRHDNFRMRSQGDIGSSRNDLSSPSYNRPIERINNAMSINIDNQMNICRNLNTDQNMNVRINSTSSDVMMNPGRQTSRNQENQIRVGPRNGMISNSDDEIIGQRNGMDDLHIRYGRMMATDHINRNETRDDCNEMHSHHIEIVQSSNGGSSHKMTVNELERTTSGRLENGFAGNVQNNNNDKSNRQAFNIMNPNNILLSRKRTDLSTEDKPLHSENMAMNNQIRIDACNRDIQDLRMHTHYQGDTNVEMGVCNDIEMRSSNDSFITSKGNMDDRGGNGIVISNGLQMELNGHGILSQMPTQHHTSKKDNGHDSIMQETDFVSRNDSKSPTNSSNLSDINIRQRKQRKPTNPQHVFMPSIDSYASFAADEVDECGELM